MNSEKSDKVISDLHVSPCQSQGTITKTAQIPHITNFKRQTWPVLTFLYRDIPQPLVTLKPSVAIICLISFRSSHSFIFENFCLSRFGALSNHKICRFQLKIDNFGEGDPSTWSMHGHFLLKIDPLVKICFDKNQY